MAEKKRKKIRVKKGREERKTDEAAESLRKKEEQLKEQNKIIKVILFIAGVFVVAILAFIVVSNTSSNFTYQGVSFHIQKFCDSKPCLVTYQTAIPVQYQGKTVPYNFYLRSDPRKLDVDFNGTLVFEKNMLFNTESDFICNGSGAIAGVNFVQLFTVLGENVSVGRNFTCTSAPGYVYVDLKQGNTTRIQQTAPACYDIYIKDCEVLQGTERFMIEAFVDVNRLLNNQTVGNQTSNTGNLSQ